MGCIKYSNLLYKAGVLTIEQLRAVTRDIKAIEEYEAKQMQRLDDEFWEEEGL